VKADCWDYRTSFIGHWSCNVARPAGFGQIVAMRRGH
jgi:hypothetical protein